MKQRRIFARYPIPKKEELKRSLEYWAKEKGTSLNNELDFYIKGRMGDILDSMEEILRETQRVKKAKKSINQAISLMTEGKSTNAKLVSNQYYKDLLNYQISNVRNKIR